MQGPEAREAEGPFLLETPMSRIEIYDTTLRDGSQGEGVNFSLQDKLLITQRLDELGLRFHRRGLSALERERRPVLPARCRPAAQARPGLRLRHDPPQRRASPRTIPA